MQVSVIVCTYNRSQTLGRALRSILASVLPPSVTWELVVVDNHSTDETRKVVDEIASLHPGLVCYVYEAKQGLSNARNAGIREARGNIIVFTDDDVTVEPSWLRNLTACFKDGTWAGAGGSVRPPEDFIQPPWLTLDGGVMDSSGVLALFNLGTVACELQKPPFGANMAFRKSMFEQYGGFRPELGRCGSSLIGNEDTEFGSRLMSAGKKLRYEPSAIVYHPVSKERLQQSYFLRWWFAYGQAVYRQSGKRPTFHGIPRAYLSLLSRSLRWTMASPFRPKVRFFWKCRLWMAVGELTEMYRGRFSQNKSTEGQRLAAEK
jgi:glucosyl-dolichyl phosphate glucuronosyltransferase